MQAYARQAKDTELIESATDIRLRAERRAGELLAEMEKAKGAREKGVGKAGRNAVVERDRVTPTLKDMGITKTQSSKWQSLAGMPDEKFEAKVARAKDQPKVKGVKAQPYMYVTRA